MKLKKCSYLYSIVLLVFAFPAMILGSDSTIGSDYYVSRIDTFQFLFDNTRVAGFAALDGGFGLFGGNTTATWDSFFPASGVIALNTGTLILNQDLVLHNVSTFSTVGNIVGNGHALDLSSSITLIQTNPPSPANCTVTMLSEGTYARDNEDVAFSNDDQYVAFATGENESASGPSTYPPVLAIYPISPFTGMSATPTYSFPLPGDTFSSVIVSTGVKFRPETPIGTYQLAFSRGNQNGGGQELTIFDFDPSNSVDPIITLTQITYSGSISALGVAWHPSGQYLAVAVGDNFQSSGYGPEGADAQARVKIYSVSAGGLLTETTQSASNPNGLFLGKEISPRAIYWDATGSYLAIGTSGDTGNGTLPAGSLAATTTPANQQVWIFNFTENVTPTLSTLALNAHAGTPANLRVRYICWHPIYTNYMSVVTDQSGSNQNVNIFLYNPGAGTVTSQTVGGTANKSLDADAIATQWSPNGSCLGVGQSIGASSINLSIYSFTNNNGTLTLNTDVTFTGAAENEAFAWSHQGTLLASGDDTPVNRAFLANAIAPSCVIWSDLALFLNNNLEFSNVCITFTGDSLIDGQGNCLTIDSTSTIIIGSHSTLAIKDITILNVGGNIIQCTDATSTITFKNTQLDLDSNYSFTVGHFDVLGYLNIVGSGLNFVYNSPTQSTVQPNAKMYLDYGVTFSYAPTIANRDLLSLVDDTAQLLLNGSTLYSTIAGLRLTKGMLVVDGRSYLSADGTSLAQGISFGDGLNAANDLTIRWKPAATLEALRGSVVYNNA